MTEIEKKMIKHTMISELSELEDILNQFSKNLSIDKIKNIYNIPELVGLSGEVSAAYKSIAISIYHLKLSAEQAKNCTTKSIRAIKNNM